MKVNQYGDVSASSNEIFDSLYQGKIESLDNLYVDSKTAEKFNAAKKINADYFTKLLTEVEHHLNIEEFDKENQSKWFMPDDYCPNLVEYLYGCCSNKEQTDRVSIELELFIQHNMIELLYFLKYLVDKMRENNIVWGVGRGSSVASYILFLIGVHKIDSIKYKLDIREFLK